MSNSLIKSFPWDREELSQLSREIKTISDKIRSKNWTKLYIENLIKEIIDISKIEIDYKSWDISYIPNKDTKILLNKNNSNWKIHYKWKSYFLKVKRLSNNLNYEPHKYLNVFLKYNKLLHKHIQDKYSKAWNIPYEINFFDILYCNEEMLILENDENLTTISEAITKNNSNSKQIIKTLNIMIDDIIEFFKAHNSSYSFLLGSETFKDKTYVNFHRKTQLESLEIVDDIRRRNIIYKWINLDWKHKFLLMDVLYIID